MCTISNNPKILNKYLIFTGTSNVYCEEIDLYICQGTVWRENVWYSILIPIYLQSLQKKQASCRKRELWGASELFFLSFFFFFSVFRQEVFQTYSRFLKMCFLSGLSFSLFSLFLVLPILCVEGSETRVRNFVHRRVPKICPLFTFLLNFVATN